jgi:hypothetical protein
LRKIDAHGKEKARESLLERHREMVGFPRARHEHDAAHQPPAKSEEELAPLATVQCFKTITSFLKA